MTTDLAIDLQTGDLLLSQIRDYAYAQAENVTQQRIHVRLVVQQGSFIYDQTGTLGSMLLTLLNQGIPAAASSIEMMIRDALEPMTDISIIDINVNIYGDGSGVVTQPSYAQATITYQLNQAGVDFGVSTPTQTATFAFPV